MDTSASASRRSTRKRKTARKHSYSPPPAYRKKVSDVYQSVDDTKKEKEEEDHHHHEEAEDSKSQMTKEVQKKTKRSIKKEVVESVTSGNEDDSGNYDTSVSDLEESGMDSPPQLILMHDLRNRKPSESANTSKQVSSNKQNSVGQSPSGDSSSVRQQSLNESTPVETAESSKFNSSFTKDSLAELKNLNPELYNNVLKKPIQEGDTLNVAIKLLEALPNPSTADTVVPFLLDAENESRKFIKDLPDSLQKPRIDVEKAWESITITYGLFGPTVVPILLHFIRQLNILETKYFNRPAALFTYTLMIVKTFHEHIMPLLSPQISVAHTWILDIIEQPFLRSYFTLIQWVKYFEPRLVPIFVCDQSIEPYKNLTEFFGKLVSDPFSSLLTELKRNPLFSRTKVVILVPLLLLKNDKLSLIALLFRGLSNIGCDIKLYSNEQDIINEYQTIKANHPKAVLFASKISLKQTHYSKVFGGLCFTFDFAMKSLDSSKSGLLPTILQLSATNSDGSIINEDTLVINNITPACICRYYLEHITTFIESFIKEQQNE